MTREEWKAKIRQDANALRDSKPKATREEWKAKIKQDAAALRTQQSKAASETSRLINVERRLAKENQKTDLALLKDKHSDDYLWQTVFGDKNFSQVGSTDYRTWDEYKDLPDSKISEFSKDITKETVAQWEADGWSDEEIGYQIILHTQEASERDNSKNDVLVNKHLTNDEKLAFAQIWEQQGREKADEFLNTLRDPAAAREAEEIMAELNGDWWKQRGYQYKQGLASGLRGLESWDGGEKEKARTPGEYVSGMIHEENLNEDGSKSFTNYLDMGLQSLGNMTPAMVTGAMPGVGTVMRFLTTLGTSGGSSIREAIYEGKTYKEALQYGLLSGSSEAGLDFLLGGIGKGVSGAVSKLGGEALEKVAKAFNNASPKVAKIFNWAGKYGGKMGGEFLEEYMQPVLDPVFRNIVFDENNEVKIFNEESLEGGILGAVMAAVFDGFGIGSAIDVRNDAINDSRIAYELSKKGLSETEVQEAVKELKEIVSKGVESFDISSSPSTSVKFDKAENYTAEKRKTISEYLGSVNEELVGFIQRIKNGEKTRPWFNLGKVNARTSADVKRLTGIDVSEYEHGITPDDVRHIEYKHGENGKSDSTMRDNNDIARLQYILENYDSVEMLDDTTGAIANSDNTPAQLLKFSKKINGTYYAVEAVPDSKKKKMRIISAYISAKEVSHESAKAETVNTTSETQLPYNADTNSIPQSAVKSQYTVRDSLSEDAKAAFDMAVEGATDKQTAANQFRIKYLEGERGHAFAVDTESELTPSMQEAAYKYGAEAARVQKELTSKSYNSKAGTVYIEEGAEISSSLQEIANTVAKDLNVPVSIVKTLGGKRGFYCTSSGEIVVAADAVVKVKDKSGNEVILRGNEAARRIILGHELTHRLKHKGGRAYARFERFVRARVPNFDNVVAKYMKTLKLDKTAATEEVICDYAMVNLFSDAKIAEEITVKHSKIAEIIRDFLEWVRVTFRKADKLSEIELAARLWNDAYSAAARNGKNGAETKNTADGDVKFSKNVSDFVDEAILNKGQTGEEYNQKRIGAVNSLGIQMVFAASGGKTDLTNKFFAMEGGKIFHEYERHKDAKTEQARGQVALTPQNIKDAIGIIENPEIVESIFTDKNNPFQSQSFALVKHDVQNGYYILVLEVVGGNRNPNIVPGMILQVTENKWNNYVGQGKSIGEMVYENNSDALASLTTNADNIKNRVTVAQFAANAGPAISPRSPRFNNSVTRTVSIVNTQSMQKSQNDASADKKSSTTGTEELLFESEAEKARYVADSFDLSGVENYKAVGSMERMSGIANSIAKAHRVNKDGRVKLAKALEKGVQNMRKAAKSDDAKVKQTAAEGFLEAAKIISPDADVQAQVEIANALAESIWAEMTTDRLTDTIRSIRDEAINAARADVRAERLAALGEKYGTIKPGERPSRVVTLPKKTSDGKKVSQTVRTVMEAEATPDDMIPTIEQMVADGEFSYETITDKEAMAAAETEITQNGFKETLTSWYQKVGNNEEISKHNTALGFALYNAAANAGDVQEAIKILDALARHQRAAAQALQATRILKKMSPLADLYYAEMSIEKLQGDLEKRYRKEFGEKGRKLKIDTALAEKVINGKTETEKREAMKEIYRDIGRQIPSTFVDKWTAWRYLAMLGNPRTHIRNILGNTAFAVVTMPKNALATLGEMAFIRDKSKRTKAFVSKTFSKSDAALLKAASLDYANVKDGDEDGGKYTDSLFVNKYVEEGRRIFKFKPLEAARRGNNALLDGEDAKFARMHYARALAGFCKARGITAQQIEKGEGIQAARDYAMQEALKATFRDRNKFSDAVARMGRSSKGVSLIGDAVLPFRRTPANILVRGIEYGPVGLVYNAAADAIRAKKGEQVTAAQVMDHLASGLTGSAILGLGVWLAFEGIVRGIGGDDKKEKEFEELMGHQQYALEIGGTSITLDWLAPAALPFFVGVNLAEVAQKGGLTLAEFTTALMHVTEPILEMSCLQSLTNLLDSGFSEDAVLQTAIDITTSYITQAIPTLFGQIERTWESERMTTYTDRNNEYIPPDIQYVVGKASAKIPGVDYSQIPYIDAWGRTKANGDFGERAFNNFANPAYTSTISESDMEKELLRLYEQTGEPVLPSRADKSFPIGGEQVYLTAEQYQTYATSKGKRSHRILTALTKSDAYNSLDDFTKAEVVSKVYTYSNAMAKSACGAKNGDGKGYALDGWVAKADDACKKHGIDEATYIAAYVVAGNAGKYVNDGKTVTNSTGLCKMQAVYNTFPDLSQEQYGAMFANFDDIGSTISSYDKKTVEREIAEIESEGGKPVGE